MQSCDSMPDLSLYIVLASVNPRYLSLSLFWPNLWLASYYKLALCWYCSRYCCSRLWHTEPHGYTGPDRFKLHRTPYDIQDHHSRVHRTFFGAWTFKGIQYFLEYTGPFWVHGPSRGYSTSLGTQDLLGCMDLQGDTGPPRIHRAFKGTQYFLGYTRPS